MIKIAFNWDKLCHADNIKEIKQKGGLWVKFTCIVCNKRMYHENNEFIHCSKTVCKGPSKLMVEHNLKYIEKLIEKDLDYKCYKCNDTGYTTCDNGYPSNECDNCDALIIVATTVAD
jgi:hypothetical protein